MRNVNTDARPPPKTISKAPATSANVTMIESRFHRPVRRVGRLMHGLRPVARSDYVPLFQTDSGSFLIGQPASLTAFTSSGVSAPGSPFGPMT